MTVAVASTAAATAAVSATNASMNADGNFFGSLDDIGSTTFKDTTSSDSLRNMGIAAITAGATSWASEAANLQSMVDAANSANAVGSNVSNTQAFILNAKVAILESAIANTTSTVVQSAINGDSLRGSLNNLATNIAVGAVGNMLATQIGNLAHPYDINGNALDPVIGKPLQLTLHAGLGCAMGAAQGGNCASGAAAGVVGELVGSSLRDSVVDGSMQRQTAIQLAGLAASGAALATSVAAGDSDHQTANNIFAGQRIGTNAAENNSLGDGIGFSPLEKEAQEYAKGQKELNENIKAGKTKTQNYLADTVANSDNPIVQGAAFTGLVATNIFFPESAEEIGLGLIAAPLGFTSRSTTLYRAVSQAELDDIALYGVRNNPAINSYGTSKLFATTAPDAAQYGKTNFTFFDQIPNTVVEVRVPNYVMTSSEKIWADSKNAISISSEHLNALKARPLNYSPILQPR